MKLACGISGADLRSFAAGDTALDDHVPECDECQVFLADLWSGGLERDLSEPVVRLLLLEEFLHETGRLGFDMASRYGKAMARYLFRSEEDE